MAPSFPGNNDLDQIISSRINASIQNLIESARTLDREGIRGDTHGTLKELLCGIVDIVKDGIKDILDEIAQITEQDVKIHRSDRIHRLLEEYHYLIDTIESNTQQIPLEQYYFVRNVLNSLQQGDIKFVIISGPELGTANLSDALKASFVDIFDKIVNFLNTKFPFYWIINVPPSLASTPLNWSLIIHEVGHILEKQKWQIVKNYYGYPTPWTSSSQPLVEGDVKSRYSQEFQADFIAVSCFGPAYALKLLALYYTREISISPTHPAWIERFALMAEQLEKMGFSTQAVKLNQVNEGEKSLISRDRIEQLQTILSETEAKLKQTGYGFTCEPTATERAKNRLNQFTSYTDDIRTLLCAADEALSSLLNSISDTDKKSDVESDFNYLIADSIRLSYIKQMSFPAFHTGGTT